jgi:hypothetical protein
MTRDKLLTLVPKPANKWNQLAGPGDYNTDDIITAVIKKGLPKLNLSTLSIADDLLIYGIGGPGDMNIRKTCGNIWQMLHDCIAFREDDDDCQWIQLPNYLVWSGQGDCKSLTLLTASILNNLGIDYNIKFTGSMYMYPVHHVYIVAAPGTDQECIIDRTMPHFDQEPPYVKSREFDPSGQEIQPQWY